MATDVCELTRTAGALNSGATLWKGDPAHPTHPQSCGSAQQLLYMQCLSVPSWQPATHSHCGEPPSGVVLIGVLCHLTSKVWLRVARLKLILNFPQNTMQECGSVSANLPDSGPKPHVLLPWSLPQCKDLGAAAPRGPEIRPNGRVGRKAWK